MSNPSPESNTGETLAEAEKADTVDIDLLLLPSGDDSWDIPWGFIILVVFVGWLVYYVHTSIAEENAAKAQLLAQWAYQSHSCVRADGSREDLQPPPETQQLDMLSYAVDTLDGRRLYAYPRGNWDCALEWHRR